MEQKKIQKKNQKKIYAILAVLAVIAVVFIGLAASGILTNWMATYKAQNEYEELIANKDNVTDEMSLRALLLLDEELEITVTKDIEIKTGFIVNGQKTLRGDAAIVANIGILQPISIMEVTNGSTLTMDGLVVDGNGIAVGIQVADGAELTYLSGEIIYAGTYGIVANGVVTIEDVSISNCSTAAVDVGFNSKVYFNGGQFVNNRHIGVYVEAQGYMEINNDALIDGTSGQGIRNRGELVIHGGKFNDIGKFVVANHNVVTIDYTGTDGGYIEMSNIGQGVVYNQNTGTVDVKDVHATNIGTDAFKCTGGTMAVENCIVEKSKAHAFYISFGDVTIKDFKAIDMNLCGIYALSPAVITLENVEFENIGTRGIMSKGATITGNNVTIKNTGTFGVSNQVSSEGVTSTNEYTNLTITGAGSNSVNISGGSKIVITDGVLGESPRTNVYIGNGEAVLNNVDIQGVATNKHAAISVSAKGTCTLDGDSKIHGNGVRAVNISGVFNMKDGEIYGYTSEKVMGAAVRLYKGGTFNMSGGSIHDNKASEAGAGAVHLNSNTTFNMTGGKIYGNTATTTGGAVQVSANSTFNMKGGSIYDNETLKYSGGAVFVLGKMNMSGGNIYENTSASVGGAINLNSTTDKATNKKVYGEFNMTGGKIYGNKATTNGGALHVSGGTTANLAGGSMYDNVAGGRGDGVNNNGNATVSGSFSAGNNNFSLGGPKVVLRIKGNTLSSHSVSEPFLLEPGNYSDIETVVAECDSVEAATSIFKVVSKGTGSYKLKQDGKNIEVAGYAEADMDMTGAETVYVSNFQELKAAVQGTTSKRIVVICADIKMEGLITVPDATTVKLRDDGELRTLSRAENTVSAFFTASFGTGLVIEPTQDGNLVLDGKGTNKDGKEFVQLMVVRGTTVIDGVVFKDNGVEGQTRDGAFISNKYGDLTITNSSFTGAYGNAGGAVTVEKGVATITGSTFEENTSKFGGGAIRVKADAELTVKDTTFKNNNAGSVGGAINNDGGVLNVVNSTFEDNKSIDGSGAINLTNAAVAEITGSTFDGNTTTATGNGKGGAAIKVNNGSDLVLDGSVFINNISPDKGGAIAAEGKSSDGKYPTITATNTKFGVDNEGNAGANTAGAAGGAVFLGKYVEASFTEDCVFANNTAATTAGALKAEEGSVVTLVDATFTANKATGSTGGAIDTHKATVKATGCTFENNSSVANGGAIYLNTDSVATFNDCEFNSNKTDSDGGAIFVTSTATVKELNECKFNKNEAASEGGAVYVNGTLTEANGSDFVGNVSSGSGGAVYVSKSATLTECTFTSNKTTAESGGAIYTKGTLSATGCDFVKNTAKKNGGAIYANADGIISADACTFTSNATETYEGGAIANRGQLTVTNSIFTTNEAKSHGGAIYVADESTLNTVINCTFDGNQSGKNGAAILVEEKAVVTVTGGTFQNNVATKDGGAIYTNGQTTVEGVKFVSNSAERAGAIWTDAGEALVSLKDTVFESNTATNGTAGAIRVQSGSDETVVMDTCSFDGNTASTYGDAIYVHASKSLTLKGGTFANADNDIEFSGTMGHINISGAIQGVTVKYSKANHKGLIVEEAGIAGSDITITPKAYIKGHELVTKTEAASEATLKEAAKTIKITDNGDGLEWVIESDGTIDALGTLQTNVAQNKETGVKYTSIQAAVNAAQSGETIYVLYDMEVEKVITVSDGKNVIITNAPGKSITIIRTFSGSLFTVDSTSTLTLGSDVTEETKDTVGTFTVDGGYVEESEESIVAKSLVNNAGVFNLKANATLQNSNAGTSNNSDGRSYGGALYNTGTVNLAGNFIGNKGYNGGAVYNADGTLNITGGVYSNNIGSYRGGAVFIANNTDSAIIVNAEMTENDVTHNNSQGVAIYLDGGSVANELTLENCNIHGNIVEYNTDSDCGSDVLLGDNTTLNLKDNINVGVVHQRYGYAVPKANQYPYADINVKENYTGKIIIVPNGGNFTNASLGVGIAQLVNYDSEMTADEKVATASQIIVRKVTNGVADDTTYCVDKEGIIQYKGARIGTTVYNTLQEAVNSVESGLSETTVIEVLYNTALSEVVAITDNKNIAITNVAGSDITLTRAFEGSLFTVESGSTLTIGSSDVTNKFVVDGGTVSGTSLVNNAGTFNLAANATIQNANAGSNKGGALYNTGTATLSGTMTGNTATHGGAVYNTGTVTVKAGTYSYNIATNGGGVIYSDSNASYVNVEAGTFEYNEAQGGTSGVIYGKATTTITGGTFQYNTAKTGGGVMNVASSCEASISNATMTGNSLTDSSFAGGAVYVSGRGTLNVQNSTISGNSADYKSNSNPGSDISLGANVTLNLKNNTNIGVVQQRYKDEIATINVLEEYKTEIVFIPYNNVPVVDAQFVVFADTMSDEAKATTAAKMLIRKYSSQTEYNDNAYYIDAAGYLRQSAVKVGETYYKSLSEAVANVPTASEEATVIEVLTNETLSEPIALSEGQKVVLRNLTGAEVKLTRDAASVESMFVVVANSSLTIDGTSAIVLDGGYVTTDTSTTIVKSLIQNAGTLTLGENVTVQNANTKATSNPGNAKNEYKGGALYNTGTATLSANFTGNTGWNGGAIYGNGGTITIIGGTYSFNNANYNGGVIAGSSSVLVQAGTFQNNTATAGGGVFYLGANLEIQGGTFVENKAEGASGGVIYCNKVITITGGTFYNNSAFSYGGVMNVYGSAEISGATMYGNTAGTNNGGSAIYVSGDKTLKLSNCNIYNNETCDIRFSNTATYEKATIDNLTANDGDDSTVECCYVYKSGSAYYVVPEQE